MFKKPSQLQEGRGSEQGNGGKPRKKGFFKDPDNLNYNLRAIVPLIVFLTSILALAVGSNILAPIKTKAVWAWIMAACLFSAFCSFIIMRAMTQPINDLIKKAQQYVKLVEIRKKRAR
jgi:hypothetical protein